MPHSQTMETLVWHSPRHHEWLLPDMLSDGNAHQTRPPNAPHLQIFGRLEIFGLAGEPTGKCLAYSLMYVYCQQIPNFWWTLLILTINSLYLGQIFLTILE